MEQRKIYQEQTDGNVEALDLVAAIDQTVEISAEVEDEFIEVVNMLNRGRKRSAWAMGQLFRKRELIIKRNHEEWQKFQKSAGAKAREMFGENVDRDEPPKSLYGWFEMIEAREGGPRLEVSYAQAQKYIDLVESGMTKEIAEEIGTNKYAVIKTLPAAAQERLVNEAIINDYTVDDVKARAAELREKVDEKERRDEEKAKHQKAVNRSIRWDEVTRGKTITITVKDFPVEYMQGALAYFGQGMKNYIKKRIDSGGDAT